MYPEISTSEGEDLVEQQRSKELDCNRDKSLIDVCDEKCIDSDSEEEEDNCDKKGDTQKPHRNKDHFDGLCTLYDDVEKAIELAINNLGPSRCGERAGEAVKRNAECFFGANANKTWPGQEDDFLHKIPSKIGGVMRKSIFNHVQGYWHKPSEANVNFQDVSISSSKSGTAKTAETVKVETAETIESCEEQAKQGEGSFNGFPKKAEESNEDTGGLEEPSPNKPVIIFDVDTFDLEASSPQKPDILEEAKEHSEDTGGLLPEPSPEEPILLRESMNVGGFFLRTRTGLDSRDTAVKVGSNARSRSLDGAGFGKVATAINWLSPRRYEAHESPLNSTQDQATKPVKTEEKEIDSSEHDRTGDKYATLNEVVGRPDPKLPRVNGLAPYILSNIGSGLSRDHEGPGHNIPKKASVGKQARKVLKHFNKRHRTRHAKGCTSPKLATSPHDLNTNMGCKPGSNPSTTAAPDPPSGDERDDEECIIFVENAAEQAINVPLEMVFTNGFGLASLSEVSGLDGATGTQIPNDDPPGSVEAREDQQLELNSKSRPTQSAASACEVPAADLKNNTMATVPTQQEEGKGPKTKAPSRWSKMNEVRRKPRFGTLPGSHANKKKSTVSKQKKLAIDVYHCDDSKEQESRKKGWTKKLREKGSKFFGSGKNAKKRKDKGGRNQKETSPEDDASVWSSPRNEKAPDPPEGFASFTTEDTSGIISLEVPESKSSSSFSLATDPTEKVSMFDVVCASYGGEVDIVASRRRTREATQGIPLEEC